MRRHFLAEVTGGLTSKWSLPGTPWSDERGNVAIMTAMLAVPLVGFSALAVDVGVWEVNKSAMQGAADQAALAAGLTMSVGKGAAQQEAKGVAAAHGFVHGVASVSVAVNIPPTTGSYVGNANAVEVVITQQQQGFMSGVILSSPPVASAKAVVVPGQAATCVMALATSGVGIKGSGSSGINTENCNIYVNSTDNCGVNLSGSSKVKGYDVLLASKSVCTSGSSSVSAFNKLQFSAPAAVDPYRERTIPRPASYCEKKPDQKGKSYNLTAGTYCGLSFGGSDTVKLEPGLYIFDGGGLDLGGSATLTGSGVTLVFTSSGSSNGGNSVSGSSSLNLTPIMSGPTAGITAGIAIWLDARKGVALDFSGSSNLTVTGAVYAPASDVKWSGSGNTPCTQLIASTITLSGSSTLRHDCDGFGVSDVGSSGGYKLKE